MIFLINVSILFVGFMRNYLPYFEAVIKKRFPADSGRILAQTNLHFKIISKDTAFALSSPNPIDRRLDFSAYFLSLIKSLESDGKSFDEIREVCLEITINYVQPSSAFHLFLKKLPVKLSNTWLMQGVFRIFHKKVSRNPNTDGFIANIITDKELTFGTGYGVDILQCGICKLFEKHHSEKFASILCEVDEITSGMAGLQMIRTGTIATGAHKCDFRYRKILN